MVFYLEESGILGGGAKRDLPSPALVYSAIKG